jgi:chaperonin GroES
MTRRNRLPPRRSETFEAGAAFARRWRFASQIHQEIAMTQLRPLQDRVLIKREKEEETSAGGIIIPDTAKEKPIRGEVMAVGNGKVQEDGTTRKVDVRVGDRVLFGKYEGTEVKIDGEERLIIREDDILGIIET